ncbi:MAG: lytic murein transglycosylase [Thiobacillus sp.]
MRRLVLALSLLVTSAQAQMDFTNWLAEFSQEARARGISQATLDQALRDIQVAPRVVELDRKQPEFVESFLSYLERRVTLQRVARGQALLSEYQPLLDKVEERYGVPRQTLVAFWGLETNYGSVMGNTPIPAALATLAFDGRRSAFFRSQLFDALALIEAGHVSASEMQGSWAGAMGQMQFMPSTYRRYAVDGDNNGRINLWDSVPDALFSAAHYLNQAGWKPGQPIALQVLLPESFNWGQARLYHRRAVSDWQALGVTSINGRTMPLPDQRAAIILPQGARGPAFMVFDNFDVVMQWNRSVHYALSVALLSDQLVGAATLPVRTESPETIGRTQLIRLQQQLTEMGFDAGIADGLPGLKTQTAIRRYQAAHALAADGFPSPTLAQHVRESHTSAAFKGGLMSIDNAPKFADPVP